VSTGPIGTPGGSRFGATLARALVSLEDLLSLGAAAAVFAIMMIVVVDVVMRYVFNAPLSWSFDLISIYLMGAGFFLTLSQTLRLEHHVNVDLAYASFSLRVRRVLKLVGWSISAGVFGWITWLATTTAVNRFVNSDAIAGAVIWPTWIPAALGALGFGVMTLRLVLGVLVLVARLTGVQVDVEPFAGRDVGDRTPEPLEVQGA
jgi:TRAP-type C4-dicarboxylate transport system permease small subunit